MTHENFCKILKEIRLSRNMTQYSVASAANISRATYSNYEQGRSVPSTDVLYTLSEVLNADLVGAYFQSLILTNMNKSPGEAPISYREYATLVELYSKIPDNSRLLLLDYLKTTINTREEIR